MEIRESNTEKVDQNIFSVQNFNIFVCLFSDNLYNKLKFEKKSLGAAIKVQTIIKLFKKQKLLHADGCFFKN
jgi:hypothetical protein